MNKAHGGKLINRMVSPARAARLIKKKMFRLRVSDDILLDAEKIASETKRLGLIGAEKLNAWKTDLLEHIRREVNRHLSQNSRVQRFIEQIKPFEKTPSLKIKRFLYTRKKKESD